MLQFLQREVCCDYQRFLASISAVNHVIYLFKPVFCATLHAEIVKDKQREAAKAGYVLVPVLVAGARSLSIKAKFVMHTETSFSIRALATHPAK